MSASSSSEHDPFPMQSEEARRLAGSGNESAAWHKMSTATEAPSAGEESSVAKEKKAEEDCEGSFKRGEDDAFLDAPLGDGGRARRLGLLASFAQRRLCGGMSGSEVVRTLSVASTLFFMIGGYWLLRSLKDPVMVALCGVTAIPKAKMASVAVVLAVVSLYNRLLDRRGLQKHRLFYIFGTFYFALFALISLLLAHPTIGLNNKSPNYNRLLGWVSYCAIESFGSVMVSLYWSFVNSNFTLQQSKASYGLLVAVAQLGSILGPTIVHRRVDSWGVANLYFLGAATTILLQLCIWAFVRTYGTTEQRHAQAGTQHTDTNTGILEGLRLFAKHNYIKGIFAISCLFEVEVTIVDYTMKVLARNHFAALHPCTDSCLDPDAMTEQATAAFTKFMGLFGQATNTLSFLLSFFGTSAVIRYLGVRLSLLLFPSLCLAVIVMVRIHPSLYVVFAAMMLLKANTYALNNPTKEILYQPTSLAVKYKAKSWIDIFGTRGSKALGSVVTNAFSDSATTLVTNGSLVGMMVATFLIWNARFMGKSFDRYIEDGHVVGAETETDKGYDTVKDESRTDDDCGTKGGVEMMASVQNLRDDTSCAIFDGDDEIGEVEEGQSPLEENRDTHTVGVARVEMV